MKKVGIEVKKDIKGVGEKMKDKIEMFVIEEWKGEKKYEGVEKMNRKIEEGMKYVMIR